MSKPVEMCLRCGSPKAYISGKSTVTCPACGFIIQCTKGSEPPRLSIADFNDLVEFRYGNAATAALGRAPATKQERIFRKVWDSGEYQGVLPNLLANKYNFPNGEMTLRDKAVAGILLQWLGSPIGQHYLNECGFAAKEITDERG